MIHDLAASGLDEKAISRRLDIGIPAVRKAIASEPQGQRGRPRAVELSPQEQKELARLMLTANTGRGTVSATMAAHIYAQRSHPQLAAVLSARASKHSLPTAVTEVARHVRGLVAPSRDPRLIRNTGVVTGGMRLHPSGRRWYAGECISIDDVTANTACCVPWPQGGDKCSDRYGVRLGRWQTLIAHCEGSSFVPLYIFAVRWHQSYRGEDAAAVVNALCRLIVKPEILRLEGGVWQGDRVLAALQAMGITLHSVKARPNQKLVERWISPFHTRMAIAMPHAQVGRYRGEEWETSKLYQACREGRTDPRPHFPMADELREATITSINWLSAHPIESRQYGRWVPQERWQADLADHPRPPVSAEDVPEWVTAPVLVERIVSRGQVKATADGPDGGGQQHNFCAPELIAWEGRKVRVAFDPFLLDAGATIIELQRPAIITTATFTGAKAGTKAVDAAKALRAAMSREIIALRPDKPVRREILVRTPSPTENRGHGRSGRAAAESTYRNPRAALLEA